MATLIGETPCTRDYKKKLKIVGGRIRIDRSFPRQYDVLADTYEEVWESVLSVVPVVGAVENGCVCRSVSLKEKEEVYHPTTKKLTLLYSIVCEFDNDKEAAEKPENRRATVSWDVEQYEEVMTEDAEDPAKKVQTACGEMLSLTRPRVIRCLNISRYERYDVYTAINWFNYDNTLNSSAFWGWPAKHALLLPPTCSYEYIEDAEGNEIKYAHVSYKIKFKYNPNYSEPWKARPLHYGSKCKERIDGGSTDFRIVQATDLPGRPCSVNLDVDGYELAPSEEPVYLEFNQYQTSNFDTALQLNVNQLHW